MKRILLVFGTRPEAVKMAPLVKAFLQDTQHFNTRVCVTAQHRQMLDRVNQVFGIRPDYDLDIMTPGQDLFDITSRVLTGMRSVLDDFGPDVVLVHGDTTTAMSAALAAFYRRIDVGHVEAGLRTYNMQSPWPEEMNRQVVDRICTWHFAPTEQSRRHLLDEGADGKHVFVTGNTVIDALLMAVDILDSRPDVHLQVEQELRDGGYEVGTRPYILVTGHRRENFGEGFIHMCTAIKDLTRRYPEVDFVYPMHLNPNVRRPIHEVFGDDLSGLGNMFFIEPLEYLSFVYLMEKSAIVLTDSGGIQEEAPGLGKPVLVMRDTTERPEALDAGTVRLVGTDYDKITREVSTLLDDASAYERMSQAVNPYGDGLACGRIVQTFL